MTMKSYPFKIYGILQKQFLEGSSEQYRLSSKNKKNLNNQTNKRYKWYPNWKKRGKIVIYADATILYIENPKDSTQKLLTLEFPLWLRGNESD